MSKKVLLTGGAGFIGHLVIKEVLEETDWSITVIDRLSYAGSLDRIEYVLSKYNSVLVFCRLSLIHISEPTRPY